MFKEQRASSLYQTDFRIEQVSLQNYQTIHVYSFPFHFLMDTERHFAVDVCLFAIYTDNLYFTINMVAQQNTIWNNNNLTKLNYLSNIQLGRL